MIENFSNGTFTVQPRLWAEEKVPALGLKLCAIAAALTVDLQEDQILRRLHFLICELHKEVPTGTDAAKKLEILNQYFFEQNGWRSVDPRVPRLRPHRLHLLNELLAHKEGTTEIVSALYFVFAQSLGLDVRFLSFVPCSYLRLVCNGDPSFIDILGSGRRLHSEEVLEIINGHYRQDPLIVSDLMQPYTEKQFLTHYLLQLKAGLSAASHSNELRSVFNFLVEQQPNQVRFLGERALFLYSLGEYSEALRDLKRYLTFKDRREAPSEIIRVFDHLRSLNEEPWAGGSID